MVQRRSISSYDQYDRKKHKGVVTEEGCENDADEVCWMQELKHKTQLVKMIRKLQIFYLLMIIVTSGDCRDSITISFVLYKDEKFYENLVTNISRLYH